MSFTHLHLHTEYSLLDGACRIEPLIEHVKSLGQTAVAMTDHGVMYGAIDFYKAAKAAGIKPIIGCECYIAPDGMKDKQGPAAKTRYHFVLLCKDNVGYQNLIKLVSASFVDGFYVKPRIDKELLKKHSEGLIGLSACLAGEVSTRLLNNDYPGAKAAAIEYNEILGQGNFYLELQNHGMEEQIRITPQIIRISKETGIPVVATNDCHYLTREDSKIQKILVCIQTNHTIEEDTGLGFRTDEFYVKSEEEMAQLFSGIPEALKNTEVIANRCNVEFTFGNTKLPHFDVPQGITHEEYLRSMAEGGLLKRYGKDAISENCEDCRARMEYELSVINSMGYTDYFLIVSDFVNYAKSKDIPVGPGRGSGAGSIVAYCIGITDIDPMKYNLLFERFLNPERVSMPDFDVDFCYERRSEVIDYVIEKYGSDHVAQIVTFGTLAARAAIKDVGRVLSIPYGKADEVAKKIPFRLGHNLKAAISISPELKKMYENDPEVRELVDTALKIESMPRHTSTHAAGVVITKDPVSEYVPLAQKDGSVVTQYTMTALEELGLLKMDFLGLRTLTVISDCEKLIRMSDSSFSLENIDYTDKATFEMFGRGDTEGVFQFESGGLKIVLTQFKPTSVEDLTALTSLYRPGPMDSIPTYIKNRKNKDQIKYKTPQLENILGVTYGCIVYQEQVMQICRELAGYSFGHADIVRRAMAKKKHGVMEEEREKFVEGCAKNNIEANVANSIFDDMVSFASYAFNKSHAACYATLAFRTAYLKCHYPAEFMASLITSVIFWTDKLCQYLAECKAKGITILPPNVNESFANFTVKDGKISFGLLAVKGLGRGVIDEIVRGRETGGPYTSFYSFMKRTAGRNFNRKAAESLIKCGALDSFGLKRRQMLAALPEVMSEIENDRRRNVEGQMGLFDIAPAESGVTSEPEMPDLPELSKQDLLLYEKETTGIYISGHPMENYTNVAKLVGSAKISELLEANEEGTSKYKDNSVITLLAMVSGIHIKLTKSNAAMANATAEDMTGAIELVIFPKTYAEYGSILKENSVLIINGRLSLNADEKPQLLCMKLTECTDTNENVKNIPSGVLPQASLTQPNLGQTMPIQRQVKRSQKLYLRFKSATDENIKKASTLLEIFSEGDTSVYFYYQNEKKYEQKASFGSIIIADSLLSELRRILGDENVVLK